MLGLVGPRSEVELGSGIRCVELSPECGKERQERIAIRKESLPAFEEKMPGKSSAYLKSILNNFPSNISFAFAYGSAIFHQANNISNNVIDLIFVTKDPLKWHKENLQRNHSHYSFLRHFGAPFVTSVQENFGAKVYYNTHIKLNDGSNNLIKYGVIKEEDLINDLLDWETLYISGRLHKPVQVLVEPENDRLVKALRINRQSAVHLSLLMLNESFTEEQLYLVLSNISYHGDFRMIVGEDKEKVSNIVKPNVEQFRKIYKPYLDSDPMTKLLTHNPLTNLYIQNCSPGVIYHHLSKMPKTVQVLLYLKFSKGKKLKDLDDTLMALAKHYYYPQYIDEAIKTIVRRTSYTQTIKGIFTVGFLKAIKYGVKKLLKMQKSIVRRRE